MEGKDKEKNGTRERGSSFNKAYDKFEGKKIKQLKAEGKRQREDKFEKAPSP